MNNNCNQNAEHDRQGQNLEHQQQQQRQSSNDYSFKAPEERPYRRRIKPPPDNVHHVQPARFRRFVQRHTCCPQLPQPQQPNGVPPPAGSNSDDAASAPSASTSAAATELRVLQPPHDAAVGGGSSDPAATDGPGRLNVTRKSMQDAYMAWCSSNNIPLSPGTMAELLPPS